MQSLYLWKKYLKKKVFSFFKNFLLQIEWSLYIINERRDT